MTESCRLRLKRPSSEGQAEPSSDVVGRRQPLKAALWAEAQTHFSTTGGAYEQGYPINNPAHAGAI